MKSELNALSKMTRTTPVCGAQNAAITGRGGDVLFRCWTAAFFGPTNKHSVRKPQESGGDR